MQIRSLLLFILGVISQSPLSAQEGQILERSILHNGIARQYLVYLPEGYTGAEPWPMIISLHGYTGTAELQRQVSNFEGLADVRGFLLAYPQGLVVDDPSGGNLDILPRATGWNVLDDPEGPDDIGFMNALIDTLEAEFNIPEGDLFAAGHSNGGSLAYRMACELSEKVDAIASVTGPGTAPGLLAETPCEPARKIPILHIHGTADPVIPYSGVDGLYPPVRTTLESWAAYHGCNTEPTVTELPNNYLQDITTVTHFQWENCEGELRVWHYRINNGGHWWPGSIPVPEFLRPFMGRTSQDINASFEIWKFFTGIPLTRLDEEPGFGGISLHAFPNPGSGRFRIEFELQEAAQVRLQVFNPLGQVVAQLWDEPLPAGLQQIEWQPAGQLPAGTYFAVLELNGRFAGRLRLSHSVK